MTRAKTGNLFALNKKTQELSLWVLFIGLGILLVATSGLAGHTILQFTLNGILVGGIYSLVALGIVIINKATGIFNFSHGLMMLFGGLIFWQSFNAIPSQELSVVLGVLTCLCGLMLFADNIYVDAAMTQTHWQRWGKIVSSQRFLTVLGLGAIAGAVVYLLLQNLEHDILRGILGGYIGSLTLGLVVDRFTIRPLLGQPTIAAIMMTLAVALLLQGFVSLIWGAQPRSLPIFVEQVESRPTVIQIGVDQDGKPIYQEIPNTVPPKVLPNYEVNPFGLLDKNLTFARNLVWGFAIAIGGFIIFVLFFQFTNTGLAMRAVAENQVLAESVGLQVRTILAVAWAIATTMAMVAAVIQGMGPGVGLSVLVIPPLALRAFPAVLLGGLESVTGALVGGLLIGVVETLASAIFDSTTGQEFAPFAVLMIVLMIRPDGLFGQRRIDRV